jgi:hypothetical protein
MNVPSQIKFLMSRNAGKPLRLIPCRGRKEAVMDEHTFFLVREAEERIRRTAMLIEQQRLHVLHLHPSRRAADMGEDECVHQASELSARTYRRAIARIFELGQPNYDR